MTTGRRVAQSLALAAACALCFSAPLLVNRYFYYNDDYQLYFAPMFTEISRLLGEGTFPLATDRSWNGGAIAGEYQLGIFNPVSLLLMFVFGHFDDVAQAAAFFAIAHYAIYCVGAFVLALSLGYTTRAAITTAVLAVSSGFLLYFGAVSWIPAVTSIAWVPWCLAALILVFRDPRFLPLGSVATAMPLLCGWPFTALGLAVLIGIGLVAGWLANLPVRCLACVALAALLGAGLSLPAILPVAAYAATAARSVAAGAHWGADIFGLLAFGVPTYASRWSGLILRQTIEAPVYYVAWFLPLLVLNSYRRILADRLAVSLVLAAIVFAVLSQMPAVWQIRWSMRHVPMLHLCLALLGGWVVSHCAGDPWRLRPTALALLAPFGLAIATTPGRWALHLPVLAVLAVLALGVVALQRRRGAVQPLLVASHVAIFGALIFAHVGNDLLPRWRPPTQRTNGQDDRGLILALYRPWAAGFSPGEAFWAQVPVGNSGLLAGLKTINGYSPLLPKGLQGTFCLRHLCFNSDASIGRFLEPDATTGLPLIDLARVDTVIAEKGPMADAFRAATAGTWRVSASRSESVEFVRAAPLRRMPGSVGWTSSPLDLRLEGSGARRETFRIVSPPPVDVDVIFATPFRPGYSASLDGASLPVTAYRGVFPMVRIPAGGTGRLVIGYRPAGLSAGLWAAGAIMAFLLMWGLIARRRPVSKTMSLLVKPKPV